MYPASIAMQATAEFPRNSQESYGYHSDPTLVSKSLAVSLILMCSKRSWRLCGKYGLITMPAAHPASTYTSGRHSNLFSVTAIVMTQNTVAIMSSTNRSYVQVKIRASGSKGQYFLLKNR